MGTRAEGLPSTSRETPKPRGPEVDSRAPAGPPARPRAHARVVLELPRSRQAPRIARRRLVESFGTELDQLELHNAKLLVSELVANAVVHGRGTIELQAHLDQDRLRVDVTDEGSEPTMASRECDLGPAGGFGLRIVDAQASSWGIREGSSHVWFELAVSERGRARGRRRRRR